MKPFNEIIQENKFNFEEIEETRLKYLPSPKKTLSPKIIILKNLMQNIKYF